MHEKVMWKKPTKGVDDPVNTGCEQRGENPLSIAHYLTQNKMQLYLTLSLTLKSDQNKLVNASNVK